MKVTLIAHTPEPEKAVACAAKLCYSASGIDTLYDGLTDEKAADFVGMLAEIGHESPIEHASFTFGIEGVSRALLAQITRHRIASYSVQSQRYVRARDGFEFVTPPEIENCKEAKEIFDRHMTDSLTAYTNITELLMDKHMKTFLQNGDDEKTAQRKAEKKAIEDARFVLPNACDTKMVATFNARSLLNFFRHRCCNRAQWEIKELADEMLKLVLGVAPNLFAHAGPPCADGACPEGKMTCGKAAEVRECYKRLRGKAK